MVPFFRNANNHFKKEIKHRKNRNHRQNFNELKHLKKLIEEIYVETQKLPNLSYKYLITYTWLTARYGPMRYHFKLQNIH